MRQPNRDGGRGGGRIAQTVTDRTAGAVVPVYAAYLWDCRDTRFEISTPTIWRGLHTGRVVERFSIDARNPDEAAVTRVKNGVAAPRHRFVLHRVRSGPQEGRIVPGAASGGG